jgi:hypothetical protein
MTVISRRSTSLLLGGALAAAMTLTTGARAEELRIGFIAPMTGLFAQVGKDMTDGFQLYLDQHGGKLGGMDVKFILEDDQAKPDLGVTKAKKLVLNDKVNMFIGGVLASTGYALAPVSTEMKTIYIASIPAADDLTQRPLASNMSCIDAEFAAAVLSPNGHRGFCARSMKQREHGFQPHIHLPALDRSISNATADVADWLFAVLSERRHNGSYRA